MGFKGVVLSGLIAGAVCLLTSLAAYGNAPAVQRVGFTVDRTTLPKELQGLPLNRLSSGALMLLDRQGNLVHAPAIRPEVATPETALPGDVALDPRVGSNIRLGDDPAALPSTMTAQAEPHIARSPLDFDFLTATFQEGRFTDGGAVDCGYSISHDGGLTWTRALIPNLTQAVGGTYYRATDPVAGIDRSGNVYLNTDVATDSAFNTGKVAISKSTDGGQNFGAPVIVYTPPTSTVFPDKNWMVINNFPTALHAGRIVVTFTRFSGNVSPIVSTFSDNGGGSWSVAKFVHSSSTSAQGSQPVFLPSGTLVIVYWNFGSNTNPGERLEAVISTDGGTNYGSPKLITNATEYNEARIRTGGFLPSAVSDRTNGYIYVVYQTLLANTPRVAFSKSIDGGKTWSVPVAITDNPIGSGVFNPAVAVSPDGQTVNAVFYDHRNHPESDTLVDMYMAQSFDGGATWQPNIRLTSQSTEASLAPLTPSGYMLGDYLGVAETTSPNVPVVPVWVDTRTGDPDPFIVRIGIAPQLNFSSWQAARMSLAEINTAGVGGVAGDLDRDGKVNLLEYVLGTPPDIADVEGLRVEQISNTFSVTYPRLHGVTDATVHAFHASDLAAPAWTNSDVTEMLLSDDGTMQMWRASAPVTLPHMFFRLQVTQP